MCCEITKTKAITLTTVETIVFGALTTGAIIGAIAAGTTLATVALSVGAAVAGIFTLIYLSNTIALAANPSDEFRMGDGDSIAWMNTQTILFQTLWDVFKEYLFDS